MLLGLAAATPADAGPMLLATFEGVIPTLTVSTTVSVLGGATPSAPVVTSVILNDVSFTGEVAFDGAKWALTSPPPPAPGYPIRQFAEVDPSGAAGTTGVDTDEWIGGSLTLGSGLGTLQFNRYLVDETVSAADVFFPYEGSQLLGYVDGLDGLSSTGFEFGDSFFFDITNAFGRHAPGALDGTLAFGDVYSQAEFSRLALDIHTGYDSSFVLTDLFGAGPPFAFSWVDPTPGFCSITPGSCDSLFSLGSTFYHVANTAFFGGDSLTVISSQYSGSLALSRVDLRAQPTVPEPASLSLLGFGLAAGAVARRRRSQG